MHKRWAPAFTIVELIIIIIVLGVLATVAVIGYNGVQKSARSKAAQSDLTNLASEMQRSFQSTGAYPTTIPTSVKSSDKITLTLQRSGLFPFYTGLSNVQNGTLFAQICSDLLAEGVGKGTDQGGTVRDYISGCGNWNDDSMQVTGWDTRTWPTPVTEAQIRDYAADYTVSNAFHKTAQEAAVKAFYVQLSDRLIAQGGGFPITSFWDYWATPVNGGVMPQPLSATPQKRAYYCASATIQGSTEVWHIDETARLQEGSC